MAEKLKTTLIDTASRVENTFKQVPAELQLLQQDIGACEAGLKLVREDVYALCTRLSRLTRLTFDHLRLPVPRLPPVYGVELSGLTAALDCAQQRCLKFKSLMQETVCAAAEVVADEQDMIGDLDQALKSVCKVRGLMLRDPAKNARHPLDKSLAKFVDDLRLFSLAFKTAFSQLEAATKSLALSHMKIVGKHHADQ